MGKTGPNVLVRKTEGLVRRHDMDPFGDDMVAIVMDLDERFDDGQIEKMNRTCRDKGYRLFISNPSFEIWLLCHFILPSHPYSQDELMEDMRIQTRNGYERGHGLDIDNAMVNRAIVNARKLLPEDGPDPMACFRHNPSTMAYSLVESIKNMDERRNTKSYRGRCLENHPASAQPPPSVQAVDSIDIHATAPKRRSIPDSTIGR